MRVLAAKKSPSLAMKGITFQFFADVINLSMNDNLTNDIAFTFQALSNVVMNCFDFLVLKRPYV